MKRGECLRRVRRWNYTMQIIKMIYTTLLLVRDSARRIPCMFLFFMALLLLIFVTVLTVVFYHRHHHCYLHYLILNCNHHLYLYLYLQLHHFRKASVFECHNIIWQRCFKRIIREKRKDVSPLNLLNPIVRKDC